MSKRNIEAVYPLSPMQQGMLFHSVYDPESRLYFEQMNCVLHGDLDIESFKRAWQEVGNRHPALRTVFAWKSLDQMLQVVHRQMEFPIDFHDWRGLSQDEQESSLDAYLLREREKGFDPSQAPLIQLALLRIDDDTYYFVEAHHHVLLDGWSLPLILKEVLTLYEGYRVGQDIHLDPARPYREYISWIEKQDRSSAEAYWRESLRGFTAPTPLVVDSKTLGSPGDSKDVDSPIQTEVGDESILLTREESKSLIELTRRHNLTINTLVLAAWALLLSRYSGEQEVLFGSTVSGRPADLSGVENMVGLFINTLPVKVRVEQDATISDWLVLLQSQLVEMRQYEYSSLVDIQDWSQVPRGLALFESILIFENYPVDQSLREQEGSLSIDSIATREQTNYPINVISASGERIPLRIVYDLQRFDKATIQRMLGHLKILLEGLAAHPEKQFSELPILTDVEKQQMLVEWNQTQASFRSDFCIHELFEAQVECIPDTIAVSFGEHGLTYAELNKRANQLAQYLQKLGVGPEILVGISIERSIEMIIGILGVLKAGGAFLPLDPTYPAERLAFMMQDSKISVLLSQSHLLERLPLDQLESEPFILRLDVDWDDLIERELTEKPDTRVTPHNLAYIIYTSGSTGLPKGTMLRHDGLCNLATELKRVLDVREGKRVLQFSALSFDASVWEIFMALANGGTLYLAEQEVLASAIDLAKLVVDKQITNVTLPPSMLKVLPDEELPDLGVMVAAGEACTPDLVERWSPGRDFYNAYGPTEATVCASMYLCSNNENQPPPIGKPISNTKLFVLDTNMHPLPVGVPGELHIAGVNVARGYLGRPEMTAQIFVPNPFSITPGSKLYKTGDLVRFREDGNIEFLGRIDEQVKLRGYRIELGEIEAVLQNHPSVRQNAVIVWDDGTGDRYMVAYIEPEDGQAVDVGNVRKYLSEKLPGYMVPTTYMLLEAIPLLPNGKVDRKALQPPEGGRAQAETVYVAPRSPVESMLAELWVQVLSVERVGVFDNFFELGGHSLLATQVISRIRQVMKVEIPIRELFEKPTVAALAIQVEIALRAASGLEVPPLEPLPRNPETAIPEGDLEPSFAQQRLWFLDQLAPGNLFYNIPVAVKLKGNLDVKALESSLNEIVRRHAALRTTFKSVSGRPLQVISPEIKITLPMDDLSDLPLEEREEAAERQILNEALQSFDLQVGPLMRVRLLLIEPGSAEYEPTYIFVLVMHHIISDGWSMGVFINEISILYDAFKSGRISPLPDLRVQYYDYASWQRKWLQGEVLDRQLKYWRDKLANQPKMLNLPTDHPRPAIQSSKGKIETFFLPAELSEKIKQLSRKENATLFMILLATYQLLLFRYSGQDDISVGTAIAGRNITDTESLIGFFVNTLVMRTDLSGEPSFRQLLNRVRDVTLGAFAHQDLPFEVLVEDLQPERDLSHTPLFQVAFALQNVPTAGSPANQYDSASTFTGTPGSGDDEQVGQQLPDLELSQLNVTSGTSKFDLTLSMAEGEDGLVGALEFNLDLFEPETIRRMIGHFQMLLEAIVVDPEQPITTLPMLTENERTQILATWNETQLETPIHHCAHQRFEEHVAKRPHAIAVSLEDLSLTYDELNRRANQLAHYLKQHGVGPEVLVGISTYRSIEMAVGVLGVLKAGGAYLPIDPTYPADRVTFMMQDSKISILLTQAGLVERLPLDKVDKNLVILSLDSEWKSKVANQSDETLRINVTPENLAYVIYTSGSTGLPKGTMLRHNGVSNLAEVQRRVFGIKEGSRILQFSPLSFDASVWETFMAFANGATLCLARQEVLASGIDLARLLSDQSINNVTLPPSVLRVLPEKELPELQTIIAAGEACSPELVEHWAPGRNFFNAYGPTETTVCASMNLCDENDPKAPPIGRPIANTKLYILDEIMEPVPVGVPGELHVAGICVARGYLERPEMTVLKFVPDPFNGVPGSVLYKTGDLVRYRLDGNIEFLGRIDHQVKVRGFRIELGEIEAALNEYQEIQEGVVVARDDITGDTRLVAYLVPSKATDVPADGEININEVRKFLRKTLPEYMIPSIFIGMDELPLSPSGKVDKKSLPAPDIGRPALESVYVAPRTDVEMELVRISEELLGVDRVGVFDNFFELGGHSLLATQFISRVRESLDVELELRQLFETPTVAEIAEAIAELKLKGPDDRARITELLNRINELSDEEVKELLELKRKAEKDASKESVSA